MPPSCSDKHAPCTGREREAGPEENKKRNNARSTSLHMSAQPQQCTSKETCGQCEGEARERRGKARRSDEGVAETHVPPNTWSPLFPYSLPLASSSPAGCGGGAHTHTGDTQTDTLPHPPSPPPQVVLHDTSTLSRHDSRLALLRSPSPLRPPVLAAPLVSRRKRHMLPSSAE